MLRPHVLVATALRGLALDPGRALLAGLGIVIGTCSLTLLLALSDAVTRTVAAQLDGLGAHQLVIRSRGVPSVGRARLVLRDADAEALRRVPATDGRPVLRDAAAVAACTCLVSTPVSARRLAVTGTSASMFALRRWQVVRGRPLLPADEARASAVAVIGPELAMAMFHGDPIGRVLRIEGLPFVVVGVTAGTGLSLDGSDSGSQVIVPLHGLPRIDGAARDEASWLVAEARDDVEGRMAMAAVRRALSRAHARANAPGAGPDDDELAIVNLAAVGDAAQGVGSALSAGFLVVALIALGVGGIGIMNVMLAGAAERVREVGIRLALGATPFEVFAQFVVESVALCALSAALGEAAAAGLAAAIDAALRAAAEASPATAVPLSIALHARDVVTGMATASAIGLVFGLHPAARAARVSPNEALRMAG